jgi:hypothetical protein
VTTLFRAIDETHPNPVYKVASHSMTMIGRFSFREVLNSLLCSYGTGRHIFPFELVSKFFMF